MRRLESASFLNPTPLKQHGTRIERMVRSALRTFIRPRSFIHLLMLGFLVIAIPLSSAFLISSLQLRQLADQTQPAVYRAVQAAHLSRSLVEQLDSMERLARQYVARGDFNRLQAYAELRPNFLLKLGDQRLADAVAVETRPRIKLIFDREARLYDTMVNAGSDAEQTRMALLGFIKLREDAAEILLDVNAAVTREVERMRLMGESSRNLLFWFSAAVVPLVALLSVIFFRLIARPIREIDYAIRRLGDGDFATAVEIHGPRDLEDLGQRLEWLRSRLEELEEQKSRFLRHVSHELKTPLTAIREGSELFASHVVGPLNSQQEVVARILQKNTMRLQKLIEDLLAFSRLPDVAVQTLSSDMVRVDELIASVVDDYQLTIGRHQLQIQLDLVGLSVEVDRVKFRTVVDNLLSNAIKYSPQGARINIGLSIEDQQLFVDIRDHGGGIESDDRPHVFVPFYQAQEQPPGPVRGTGLGLSIARECARVHGGDVLLLESGADGAHFRFSIPLESRRYHLPEVEQDKTPRLSEELV